MKQRLLFLLILSAFLGTGAARAQLVSGRLVTSFATFERYDTVAASRTYLRAFQTVQLSVAQGDFSLNTYLQGAVNGTSEFGDQGRVRFSNLYVRWANIAKVAEVSLGRQAIFAGAGNGPIDGVSARGRFLNDKLTVVGYGGSTVNRDYTGIRSNWHDNLFYGGQVIVAPVPGGRIGASYMNRSEEADPYWTLRARDASFVPVAYYIASAPLSEQIGSADASYEQPERFSVYGRYDYDFNFRQTSRGQGMVRVNVTPALALTGDVIYRQPRISYNSIFSAFTSNATTEIEGGIEYGFTPDLRAFGKFGSVSYTDDNSARWTAGLSTGYGSVSYSGSNGYAGELTSLSVQGAYPLLDRMVVPTLGISYASYKLSTDAPKDNAFALLAGATVRPTRHFTFDIQGQWMKNSVYDRDMRLQLKLMYWFAERLSIFSEEVK